MAPIKSHCKNGHPRTPENLTNGGMCRICKREYSREYKKRPDQRAKHAAYERMARKKPERIEWSRKHESKPERVEARRKKRQTPEMKEYFRKYRLIPENAAKEKTRLASEHTKEVSRKYWATRGKALFIEKKKNNPEFVQHQKDRQREYFKRPEKREMRRTLQKRATQKAPIWYLAAKMKVKPADYPKEFWDLKRIILNFKREVRKYAIQN